MHQIAQRSRQFAEAEKRYLNKRYDKDSSHQRQGFKTEVVLMTGQAECSMPYPGVEAIPETGGGETEESARKSCSYEDCWDFSHDDWLKRFRPTTQQKSNL